MILMFVSMVLASPIYPSDLVTDLGMPCTPACTVCHQSNAGGDGTATQDFAVAMLAHGLTGGSDSAALQSALDGMTTDQVDSDGDGTPDTEALTAGIDPNTAQNFCADPGPTPPHYGCGPASSALLVFGGLLGAGGLRRRLGR